MKQAGGSGGMQPAAAGGAAPLPPGREVTVGPVEIKTGKMHDSHKAQVLLYLLLMEERYGKPLDWGMLWYTTQTGGWVRVCVGACVACTLRQ
jgi:CRISPR/Cas system-associated exonuclease Cas4 (RecB family)